MSHILRFAYRNIGRKLKFNIITTRYDPFKKWIPYIDYNDEFAESFPMQTNFTVSTNKKNDVINMLTKKGYTCQF